jgi:WD40 repeat protein
VRVLASLFCLADVLVHISVSSSNLFCRAKPKPKPKPKTKTKTQVWNARSGACQQTLAGHHGELSAAAFSYAGHALTASVDGTCRVRAVWGSTLRSIIHQSLHSTHDSTPNSISCITTTTHPPTLSPQVWDVGSGRAVHDHSGHNDAILDAAFSVTGSHLATVSADGTGRVYSTRTGACQSILLSPAGGAMAKVAFNPQGSCVLTAGGDGAVRLWDAATGDCLQVRLTTDSFREEEGVGAGQQRRKGEGWVVFR